MKRVISGIAMTTCMFLSAAHATPLVSDSSSSLTVQGSLKDNAGASGCAVSLSRSSVEDVKRADDIPVQGEDAKIITSVKLSVNPINPSLSPVDSCSRELIDGKVGLKLTGPADTVEGTALANTLTGDNAASGIGFGIFTLQGKSIPLNSVVNIATDVNSGTAFIGVAMVKLKGQTATEGNAQSNLTVEVAHL
ncbi:fimbrial protein [Atlantibacter hermannii]|uniref:fimbrial protein n=1 Tax=Atlantibacter hermannii TaxID=565 RepID=UPI0028AB5361|nr:fimbrial protein [Atlantibacter hermannii]MDU7391373.1 fimbrial protein [Atlantibacter hermannii]